MTKLVDYLKQMLSGSKMLAKQTGYPAIYFFVDCLWSHLRYGCINRHYFFGGFWALRGVQRKDSLTYLRILKAFKRMNDNTYVHLLERKEEFNNHFKDLISRDWIYIRNSSLEQLKNFLAKHEYMMVKPISACEGHGIRKVSSEEVNKIGLETVFGDWKTEDVIVEEVIQQHPRMVFGNKSVNTIRMYSVYGGVK